MSLASPRCWRWLESTFGVFVSNWFELLYRSTSLTKTVGDLEIIMNYFLVIFTGDTVLVLFWVGFMTLCGSKQPCPVRRGCAPSNPQLQFREHISEVKSLQAASQLDSVLICSVFLVFFFFSVSFSLLFSHSLSIFFLSPSFDSASSAYPKIHWK